MRALRRLLARRLELYPGPSIRFSLTQFPEGNVLQEETTREVRARLFGVRVPLVWALRLLDDLDNAACSDHEE